MPTAPPTIPCASTCARWGRCRCSTREGEVSIAKRIEAGQYERQLAVLATPYGVREILATAELLRKGSLDLRSVLDGLDEIEPVQTHEERRKDFLLKTAKVKRIDAEIAKKLACVANSRTSEDTRKRLRGEIDELLRQVVDLMRETRFSKSHIEEIMEGLQTIAEQLRAGTARLRASWWRRSRSAPRSSASWRRSPRGEACARRRRSSGSGAIPLVCSS